MIAMPASTARKERWCGAIVLGLMGVALVGLGVRLVSINTTLRPKLMEIARRQQAGRAVLPACRGMILDRRGRVVASSRLVPDVFVDPSRVDDDEALALELAARLSLDPGDVLDAIRRRPGSRFVVIARGVEPVEAEAVLALESPGVGLVDRAVRNYPLGFSLSHVLGFVGSDGSGLEGAELALDAHLRGEDGLRTTIRDARRRALRRADSGAAWPKDGGHVVLTIDSEIQRVAERELARQIEAFEAKSGVAIVMSPKTGDIYAMACWPAFDPNDPGASAPQHRRNQVLTDPVEPGSTFKAFIAAGALAGGFVSTTETIDCHMGTYRIGRRVIRDVRPHGLLTIRGIVSQSSNIGMGIVAERMGNDALWRTVRAFGFGEPTGIELPGEATGLVRAPERWGRMSTNSVAMGYEISVTPLQLIVAYGSLLNDGVLIRPRIVKQLLAPDGSVLEGKSGPEVVRRVVPSPVARYMCDELLAAVVNEGGGWRARLDSYGVVGKTGTAKLTYADRRGYEPDAYLSSFVGAAPARDPEVVALVMIRRPNAKIGYYGGKVAAPAVGAILEATLTYLDVLPDAEVMASAR